MPGNPSLEEPFLRLASPRTAAWFIFLTILALACISWATLPTFASSPLLRTALFALGGFAMLGLVFSFPETTDRNARRLILVAAILLRLFLWPAAVSDDVNRYLWEGELVSAGENPYSAPADAPRWADRRDNIWENMNHRDRPTAYPPGIQWINAATTLISPSLKSFKVLALLGDISVILLLFTLLRENMAPIRWVGFWAFNPVVLISFAAEAHFDSLMAAALLAAILAATREKKSAWLWLGIAIQIKLVCLVLVPLFLTKKLLRGSYILPLVLILPGLPFLSALPGWIEGLRQFAGESAFNAPLFTFLSLTGLAPSMVKILCTTTFAIAAVIICNSRWRGKPLITSALLMMGALLVCSPIVHFWYLTWLLPLACIRPSFAWTTLSITIAGYFLAWHTLATESWWGFRHPTAALIWLPFILAAIAQNRFKYGEGFFKPFAENGETDSPSLCKEFEKPFSILPSLSIIIPVLKPTPDLLPLLKNLRQTHTHEILIVATEEPTFPLPEKTITAPRGRGNQIAAGIHTTSGDWILVVHSDTTPHPGFSSHLQTAIATHPQASLLVFGQRFDKQTPGTLLIEALNEIRVVFGGVAFGDQTMLIRRAALESAGGFPAQPLMEDVESSMRLATRGDVIYLGREWKTSAQKWNHSFTKRVLLVLRLVATYQLARLRSRTHASQASESMYNVYYRPSKIKPTKTSK